MISLKDGHTGGQMDVWSMTAVERAALVDRLAALDDEQWAAQSLCTGWSVRGRDGSHPRRRLHVDGKVRPRNGREQIQLRSGCNPRDQAADEETDERGPGRRSPGQGRFPAPSRPDPRRPFSARRSSHGRGHLPCARWSAPHPSHRARHDGAPSSTRRTLPAPGEKAHRRRDPCG